LALPPIHPTGVSSFTVHSSIRLRESKFAEQNDRKKIVGAFMNTPILRPNRRPSQTRFFRGAPPPSSQLGAVSSSQRFKHNIKGMDRTSDGILALKPVTFHYKGDKTNTPQLGLIAEDVAKVNPDLVVRDENGELYTVRYDAVNVMLLNEFLKEHKAFLEEQRKVGKQEKTIVELKSGMTALAATLKEQAEQIQKVSAQLDASKPAPQVVNNP
jgi:hypothetical protein